MKIVSINVGRRETLAGRSFNGVTGICKRPVAAPVRVSELGLEADAVVNGKYHGGPDQAVYVYRQEDYHWWSAELGQEVTAGTFGDNLTLSGLPQPDLLVGSRLAFGAVLLEVTAPRIPCNTLAQRMGDRQFAKRFMRAERPGAYCRVLATGALTAGDAFTVLAPAATEPQPPVSIIELFRASKAKPGVEQLRRYLAAPIDARSRQAFERRLRQLSQSPGR
ncbi:MAG: MOSC domain-containing protein [Pseudomonadales bacterium]